MSGVKISALPAANQANADDQLEANQAGTTRRITVDQVAVVARALAQQDQNYGSAISGDDVFTSQPLVSTQAYAIREAMQTPSGTTISIRLQHRPAITPTTLTVRVDCGWHGATMGEHPAAGTWSCVPGMNEYWLELVGSTWVADSMFLEGHCYVPGTIFDASVNLNDLLEWCRASGGPTVVQLPPGMMYVQNEVIRVPEGCTFQGHGMRISGFFLADRADQPGTPLTDVSLAHVLETGGGSSTTFRNVSGTTLQDFSIHGNRAKQIFERGTHAVALGGDQDLETDIIPVSFAMRRVGIFGSAGYGMAMQGYSLKENVEFSDILIRGSDNDGCDYKNRGDGNTTISFNRVKVYHWALADIGTNLRPVVALPTDPVTTTLGSTDFDIPRYTAVGYAGLPNASAGQTATLTGTGSLNGIALNGSYRCVAVGNNFVRLRSLVAATASGTGGGGGMTVFMPSWSFGDVPLDARSLNTRFDQCYAEGWLLGRGGFRQRGGEIDSPNGIGAHGLTMNGCTIKDTSPDWTADVAAARTGFQLEGRDATVINCIFDGAGAGIGIYIGPLVRGAQIISPLIKRANEGARIGGSKISWNGGIIEDAVATGVTLHGGSVRVTKSLPDDPFTPQAIGTAVVIVNDPAHGLINNQRLEFSGHTNGSGIIINASNEAGDYPVTVIDADHYSIVAGGSATSLTPFGGTDATVFYPVNPANIASDIHFSGVVTRNSPGNTCVAWSLGELIGGSRGQADDISIEDCHVRGTTTSLVKYASNVTLGPGNTGLLNAPNPASVATYWQLVAEKVVTTDTAYLDFQNLDYPEIRVEVTNHVRVTGSTGIAVSYNECVTVRDKSGDMIKGGDAGGSASVIFIGSTAGGVLTCGECEITQFNQLRRSYLYGAGGAEGAALDTGQVALQQGPRGAVGFFSGTVSPGVNRVTQITVGGVPLLAAPVDMAASVNAMATAVVAEINLNSATSGFTAFAEFSNAWIREAPRPEHLYGNTSGLPIVVTIQGDVVLNEANTAEVMGSTRYNALRVFGVTAAFTSGTFRIYQRGG